MSEREIDYLDECPDCGGWRSLILPAEHRSEGRQCFVGQDCDTRWRHEPIHRESPPATDPEDVEAEGCNVDRHYGGDCPVGMVQVEFVGCPPAARISEYGWKPVEFAFLEVWVDGKRFRIDVGNFHDGKAERRGIHVVYDLDHSVEQTSMNACSVYFNPETPSPEPSPLPEVGDVVERVKELHKTGTGWGAIHDAIATIRSLEHQKKLFAGALQESAAENERLQEELTRSGEECLPEE